MNSAAVLRALVYCLATLFSVITWANTSNSLFNRADTFFYPINHNEQIPWGIVTTLMQDHEGYIWAGSQKGLLRFDGYQFKHYTPDPENPNALANTWVESLVEVNPGQIWVGSRKGFSILDTSKGSFKNYNSLSDGETEISMLHIAEILPNKNKLWFVADKTIVLVTPTTLTAKLIGQPRYHDQEASVNSIQFRNDTSLWVGTSSGLFIYDISTGEFNKVDEGLSANINKLTLDPVGNLWISTIDHGLRKISKPDAKAPKSLQSKLIGEGWYSGVVAISDTEIWAMKYSGGIIAYNLETDEKIKQMLPDPLIEHSLSSMDVRAILKDKSGIVWVGQWGGGIRLYNTQNQYVRPFSLRSISKQQTDFQRVANIKITKQSGIWLLGGKKAISLDPNQQYKVDNWPVLNQFLKDSGDATAYFSASRIQADGSEILYFITGTNLFFSFHPKSKAIEKLPGTDALDCRDPSGMLFDGLDQLWLSCRTGSKLLRYNIKTHVITFVKEDKKNSIGLINNLQEGPDRNFWMSTTNGLYTLSPSDSDVISLRPVEFFSGHHIMSILFSQEGNLWVDGFSGLFSGKKNGSAWSFESISEAMKQKPDQQFGNMLFDDKGWIWGDEGALDTSSLTFYPLRKGDGFNTGPNWIGSFAKLDDGTLVFGSDQQLMVIRPDAYTPWDYSAPAVATRVFIDNKPLSAVPTTIELDANNESVSIDIALLDFSNPNKNTYAYKLEGINNDWIYTDAENRRINYNHLPAGSHTLTIKGANVSKIWSPNEVTITINKAAALHETTLFRTAVALCFFGLIWAGYLLKLRHHRARERHLKALVDERTQELQSSLIDLKATQEKLVDTEKQALLGRLVRGLAHELNTPLGIIKMTESMLNDRLINIFSVMSDCAIEAAQKFEPEVNKILGLLKENLERTITLVQHFKSVDIDNTDEARQWVELEPHIDLISRNLNATVELSIPAGLAISCAKNALTLVITELIKNAQNHGGDTLSILGRAHQNDDSELFEIIVQDHQQGIAEDIMPKIFDPFFSSKFTGGSPGLGLYMVENIVKFQLCGEILAESELGGTTSFTIKFPAEIQYKANNVQDTLSSVT